MESGEIKQFPMIAGVPQGSVLGPTLWNIAYDVILRGLMEDGCRVLCYADDTLVLAEAEEVSVAIARANVQTGLVLSNIKRLGLEIAVQKTEIVCFVGRRKLDRLPVLEIDGVRIESKRQMKYLGVILDDKLSYVPHLDYLEGRVSKVVRAIYRITPNLRGSSERRKRLYANIVLAVIMYASPV